MLLSTRRERRIDVARVENAVKIGDLGARLVNPDGGVDSIAPLAGQRRAESAELDKEWPAAGRAYKAAGRHGKPQNARFLSNTGNRGKV